MAIHRAIGTYLKSTPPPGLTSLNVGHIGETVACIIHTRLHYLPLTPNATPSLEDFAQARYLDYNLL